MLAERLEDFWYPFDAGERNRTLASYGSVLRNLRIRLSHVGEYEVFNALHVVDTVRTIPAHIADTLWAGQAAGVRTALIEELAAAEAVGSAKRAAASDQQLREWECDESAQLSGAPRWGRGRSFSSESTETIDRCGRTASGRTCAVWLDWDPAFWGSHNLGLRRFFLRLLRHR